jgi:tetratricopeptide (TPR) repeat protein
MSLLKNLFGRRKSNPAKESKGIRTSDVQKAQEEDSWRARRARQYENMFNGTSKALVRENLFKDQEVQKVLVRLREAFAFQARLFTMDEGCALRAHQQQVVRELDAAVAVSGDAGVAALLRFVAKGLTSPDQASTREAIRALGRARATQAVPVLLPLLHGGTSKELKVAAGEALSMIQGGPNPWGLLQQAEDKSRVADGDERLRLLDQIDSRSFDLLDAQEKYYVWYLRAIVYKCRGDRARAIECLKTGLKYSDSPRNLAWRELKELQDPEIARRTVQPASELFYYFICSGNESLIKTYHDLFRVGVPAYGGSAAYYRANHSQLDGRQADPAAASLLFAGQECMGPKVEEVGTVADVLARLSVAGYRGVFISFVTVGPTGRDWVRKTYTELLGQAVGQGILPFFMYTTASKDAAQFLLDSFSLVSAS